MNDRNRALMVVQSELAAAAAEAGVEKFNVEAPRQVSRVVDGLHFREVPESALHLGRGTVFCNVRLTDRSRWCEAARGRS